MLKEKLKAIDKLNYPKYEAIDWEATLQSYFINHGILEITDFDRQGELAFLISLNENNENIDNKNIDFLLTTVPMYYFEVCFALDKPLSYCSFWKYHSGKAPQKLEISETAFLKEHQIYKEVYLNLALDFELEVLNFKELGLLVSFNKERVNIYYKYFNQNYDKRKLPFQEGVV